MTNDDLIIAALIHELRQPLTGARAGIHLFEKKLESAQRDSQEWHIVKAQVDRLGALLDGYKELVNPGAQPGVAYPLDGIVARAIDAQVLRLSLLGARFVRPPPTGAIVRGRPQALLHALANLIENALDAIENKPEARLQISVAIDGDAATVSVSDEGSGVDAAFRERLFQPMHTTKGARGTGLGLFISKHVLDRTGGRIELVADNARRVEWARTELAITLPIESSAAHATALVLEDEESLRFLLGEALRHDGYSVSLAPTCAEAYALLRNNRYDVILTDKNLPDGSGVDVAKLARELDPAAVIVLATGYANMDSAGELISIVDAYIEKPFSIVELSALLKDARKRRKAFAAAVVPQKEAPATLFMPDSDLVEPLRRSLNRHGIDPRVVSSLDNLADAGVLFVAMTSCNETVRQALLDVRARKPHLAFVAVSETDKLSDRVTTILIGAVDLLVSPWNDKALDRALSRAKNGAT